MKNSVKVHSLTGGIGRYRLGAFEIKHITNPSYRLISKVKSLAGAKFDDPVFRVCMTCKAFQWYDDNYKVDSWYDPRELTLAIAGVALPFLHTIDADEFPVSSHGICPDCEGEFRAKNGI